MATMQFDKGICDYDTEAAVLSTVGRILPRTPKNEKPVAYSANRPRANADISRSFSDNKHYNNYYHSQQFRRIREGRPSSSTSATPATDSISMTNGNVASPKPSPSPIMRHPQSPRTSKTSVLRSHSHVNARRPPSRLIGGEKSTVQPRYSYDGNAATGSGPLQLTLVLMGAPMVGKSTIVNQFLWEIFLRDYRPTVEEFNWIEYGSGENVCNGNEKGRRYSSSNLSSSSSIDSNDSERSSNSSTKAANQNLLLQIIDSAGSRDFLAMRYLYYKIGDAFMIVYSVKDPLSYAEALLMVREIQQRNSKNVPILLVANKVDLEDENAAEFELNSKSKPQILASFPIPQNIDFMRLSAKNLNQVKQAFNRLIDELAQKREICGDNLRRPQLQKRRQSMPSRRTANELGIDPETLERLVRHHNSNTKHSNCTIS